MKAILVISHGSHSLETKREVSALIKKLRREIKIPIVEYAFLEIESPSISEGIDMCIKKGAKQILITLNFLNSGKHVDQDIPRIVAAAEKKYPAVKFKITSPVGQHPRITELFCDLIKKW